MTFIYDALDLDNVIRACIEFKENFPNEHFFEGYIGGRQGLGYSLDGTLQKKMKYIAGLDINVLEYLGYGNDNIEYFEMGPNANKFLSGGGFKKYFAKVKRQSFKKETALWSPILISTIALFISALTWLYPVTGGDKIEELQTELDRLKQRQINVEKQLDNANKNDTMALKNSSINLEKQKSK